MICTLVFVFIAAISISLPAAEPAAPAKIELDRLDCRWTFGNHEPIAMYRRAGGPTTGGMEGSALWLKTGITGSTKTAPAHGAVGPQHASLPVLQGMGWRYESQDFPNVKRFVGFHKHNIRVLAYAVFDAVLRDHVDEIPTLPTGRPSITAAGRFAMETATTAGCRVSASGLPEEGRQIA